MIGNNTEKCSHLVTDQPAKLRLHKYNEKYFLKKFSDALKQGILSAMNFSDRWTHSQEGATLWRCLPVCLAGEGEGGERGGEEKEEEEYIENGGGEGEKEEKRKREERLYVHYKHKLYICQEVLQLQSEPWLRK